MKKLLAILLGLCFTTIALTNQLSYDQASITPETWEEVDLTYINTIDGKDYTEQANLLRPISWIKHNHLDKVGSTIHLTKEQLGTDVAITVVAIKPTSLDYSNNNNNEGVKPIIATFITHSKDVGEYTFKGQYGHQEKIRAISSHPFYVPRLNSYVPIGNSKSGERLKSSNGTPIIFINKTQLNQVESVYNFEVYQKHNYVVGKQQVLVHNQCGCLDGICQRARNVWQRFRNGQNPDAIVHTPAVDMAASPPSEAINEVIELPEIFPSSLSTPLPDGTPNSQVMAYDLDSTLLSLDRIDKLDDGTSRLHFTANQDLLNEINLMFTTQYPSRQMIVVTAGNYDPDIIQDFFRQTIQQELHETRIFNRNSGVIPGKKGQWLENNIVNKGYKAGKITLYDDEARNLRSVNKMGMNGEWIIWSKYNSGNSIVHVMRRPPK